MKAIGLIGGMSWESTAIYYRLINEGIKEKLGGHHSAKIILHSVDFAEIEQLQRAGQWDEAGRLLSTCASKLEAAGAECLVLCTNTMHKVAGQIEAVVKIPLLHIADATAESIRSAEVNSVGLLGTRFTMEQEFYVGRLRERHGLQVAIPNETDRAEVHRVIYDELCAGQVRSESRDKYLRIIDQLVAKGAQGIILGCTEITMLIKPDDFSVPAFDTTELHARKAIEFALS